ncbi:hypothetical protein GXM_03463 [Nostoc sphaeroides CCNUC1]|uniref:Uncharacterized protein n=1 Tax=Nostoc sphaeroides CCNUC1 TaxID=2653204 RepID=A0A5P8W076_9NOSO|nr:hypothetical protein GXM_03463 [Nostoc sphaeroides CCNUC1]
MDKEIFYVVDVKAMRKTRKLKLYDIPLVFYFFVKVGDRLHIDQ